MPSTYGGVAQRWVLIYSEPRQAQARRTVEKHLRKQSDTEVKAFKQLCSTSFACEADARQALAAFEPGLQATFLSTRTVHATPRYSKRGRPGRNAPPDQVGYQIEGALASSLPPRQALLDQHSWFILATNELDTTTLPPHQVLHGYKGQGWAERGFRF